ncbi:hypothetical protein EYF80_036563 [Liparis tanakae]|uniref:Uncharacterized protein n=1 Tax=Liparis tanakae TaxID=230148 RepID=A0A4Z2GKE8_9TELE|nr:hypothetical protein EYF80_036563 [Liparis tanakae]
MDTNQTFRDVDGEQLVSLGQQLQVAPPTGVGEWNQQHGGGGGGGGSGGGGVLGAGGCGEAGASVHAPLLQRQRFLFPGKILQHAGMMALHRLQGAPEQRSREGGGGGLEGFLSRL